ncbi:diguanylate cyclase [Pseudoalteromonas sp. Hal099]
MEHLANFDILTGLPNRMFIMGLLKEELTRCKNNHQDIAIMFLT